MTLVKNNIPNVRNTKKGMLKHKEKEKAIEKQKSMEKEEKKSTPDDTVAVVGNNPLKMKTIHPAHENFNMVFNIMLGIKKSVDSTLDIPLLRATQKDFSLKC
tara:strand:+ start:422 stop:727 length:306 start_codon:yes stop_codon:yes gene_type:complete